MQSRLFAPRWLALALTLSLTASLPAESAAPAAVSTTRHWTLELAGQKVGSFVEITTTLPGGGTRTHEAMRFALNRLGNKVSISTDATSTENAEGELLAIDASTALGSDPVKIRAVREGQHLRLTTESAGKSFDKSLPLPTRLLGPQGIRRLSREKLRVAGDSVGFAQFSPEGGTLAQMQRTVIAPEGADLAVEEVMAGLPVKTRLVLDRDGQWLRRAQTLPFGELLLVPSTAEAARLAEGGGTLPEESYDRTMARSNIRLPDPRSISRLTLELTHRRPELGWPDFRHAGQAVTPGDAKTLTVIVQRLERGEPAPAPGAEFRGDNALLQASDPEIQRLARDITSGRRGDLAKARALQDWVASHMEVDLGIALASAAEVVRHRRGTCIAAAVLLAALQRAAGLPSRIALGLVYYSGIWGGHAWTEVYVDGRWLSLDATMYAPGAADAARLRFATSSGEDRLAGLNAAGLQMFGNVEVRTRELTLRGRRIRVPADAKPHEVADGLYTNRWLGFRLEAPAGYRIAGLDSVFPDTTVLAVENASGTRVRIGQTITGAGARESAARFLRRAGENAQETSLALGDRTARAAFGEGKARLVLDRGTEAWTLVAEGPEAATALRATAAAWRWQ